MEDRGLITINRERVFRIEEARQVLPVIRRFTHESSVQVEALMARLETVSLAQTETIARLEAEINDLIRAWHEKVKRLGARPKGLWLVDFDSGDGYFCWKYPEPEVNYWHGYNDGFSCRRLVPDAESPAMSRPPEDTA